MRALAAGIVCVVLASCGGSSPPPQTASQTPASAPSSPEAPSGASDRSNIVGVWKLVSFEQNEPDGNISMPYGEKPAGRLTFDNAGRISVFVMKEGRVASVNSTGAIATAPVEDLRQIADGFLAYYGSFETDDSTKTLTAHVEACTIPAWTNTEQKRTYELVVDSLTLVTPATKLVWTRLPN
ncbi:MAG: lipocalin-like domain-containing protein [Acidobacteriota bacterium]